MKRNRFDSDSITQEERSSSTLEYTFNEKQIVNKQTRLSFILDKCTDDGTVMDYDTVKLKGVTYSIGDFVELNDPTKQRPYVAKLKRFVKVPDSIEKLPFAQIQWCLNKRHLPEAILSTHGKHISEAETFPAVDLQFCIYIDSIKNKCFVVPFEEYVQMASTYEYYYFTRSNFMSETAEIIPSFEDWEKHCACMTPYNPDYIYVQCDNCRKWFHDFCIGEFNLDQNFICKSCIATDKDK